MKRIAPILCVIVLTAANSAFGQGYFTQTTPEQRNNVTFSSPVFTSPAELNELPKVTLTPNGPQQTGVPHTGIPANHPQRMLPTAPHIVMQASGTAPATMSPQAPPPQAMPAQGVRPVAQNAITLHHRLRLAPPSFERNFVEKLGSRFVPVRNVDAAPGLSRYNLPLRDGTAVEIAIDHPRGIVAITGSPPMAAASLQVVQFLDITEQPGGAVTRFIPVQQSNLQSARRVAGLVNQEMVRVAQAPQPPSAAQGAAANGAPINGDAESGDASLGRVLGNVTIDIIDAFGTIVIQGSPDDVAVVQEMVRQLEILSLENEPIIEIVPMRHADSLRISQLVQQLYQQVYLQRRGMITIMPLVKPNSILLIGLQESIIAAKELIAKLDTPVNPNARFQIFQLRHAVAAELQAQITQAFAGPENNQILAPRVHVVADTRTNSLLITAHPRDMLEVEAMIRQMDVPGPIVSSWLRVFPLRNAIAADTATVIVNALTSSVAPARATTLEIPEDESTRSSVAHNVSVVADARNNSLIVTAPPSTMPLIEQLILQLDRVPLAESKIRVFTLINGDAFALTTMLTNIFAQGTATQVISALPGMQEGDSPLVGVRFQTDVRTNSIVAIGGEADLAIAEALLLRLDSENLNNRQVFTVKLVNMSVEDLVGILTNHVNNERQIYLQNQQTYYPVSPLEQYLSETSIVAEPISNSLVISTSPRYHDQVLKIIKELDERPQMVAIEVLIAEVEIKNNRDRGVEFGLQDSVLFNRAMGGTAVPNTLFPGLIAGNPIAGNSSAVGTQGVTSLGVGQGSGFSFSASGESVSIFVRALETQSKSQVLGRPRLVTLHNRRAQVVVGESVPYNAGTTITDGGTTNTSTTFMDVGTTLDITPRIMPDDMIAMAVYVQRSNLIDIVDVGGSRAPHTRVTDATTTLQAMDGQTVVFAGLISETRRTLNNSIPGLNKIPVLKHFFEYDSKTNDRSELLIVLTPRILRSQEDMNSLNQKEFERMQWVTSDVVKLTSNPHIRRRSDVWQMHEVRHTFGDTAPLQETQLPPVPMFPVVETR